MIDRLGKNIEVGCKVLLLKTPVSREHEFIKGVVVRVTDKKVHVHVVEEDYHWSDGVDQKIYKRSPEQLVVTGG